MTMPIDITEAVDFKPRLIDDHTGDPGGDMQPEADVEMVDPIAAGRAAFDDAMRDPESGDLREDMKQFSAEAIEYLERLRQRCESDRETKNFAKRQARNERRWTNEPEQTLDREGKKTEVADYNLDVPVTSGLTAAACDTVSSFLISAIFHGGDPWFQFEAKGKKEENERLEAVARAIAEEEIELAELDTVGPRFCRSIPKRGTAALRYRMVSKLRMEPDENGVLREARGELRPLIERWPLKNLLVTNLEEPDPRKQEGVFWITPTTNVHKLEENEATFEAEQVEVGFDDMNQPVIIDVAKRMSGEFFNLDILRDMEGQGLVDMPNAESSPRTASTRYESKDAASNFLKYDLIEYEGALPMYRWVTQGLFTWRMARALELDMGMPDPGDDPIALREFARRLDKISVWKLSYVLPPNDVKSGVFSGLWIQLSISHTHMIPGAEPRNSLYVGGMIEDEDEFYRRSVADRGWRSEDLADCLRAARAWIVYYNAHAAAVIDDEMLEDKENAARLLEPNKRFHARLDGNKSVKDLIQFLFAQMPEKIDEAIASEEFRHQQSTGVFGANLGDARTESGTLGEQRDNRAEGEQRMAVTLIGIVMELHRLLRDMLADRHYFMDENEYMDHVRRVAGADADDFAADMFSPEQFWRELRIVFPATLGRNKTVMRAQLQEDVTVFGPFGVMDMAKALEMSQRLGGNQHGDKLVNAQVEPRDPEDEFAALRNGERVQVSPAEDFFMHLQKHQEQLALWDQFDPTRNPQSGVEMETWKYVAEQLGQHIQQTMTAAQAAMQAAMQAQGALGSVDGATPPMMGPGGAPGGVPGGDDAVMNGLNQAGQPSPGVASQTAGEQAPMGVV